MLLLDNQFDTNAFMSILGPKLALKVNYHWVSNYLKKQLSFECRVQRSIRYWKDFLRN
jgi:hypothetical protein